MLGAYFSPLAPAVVLLLGAFILLLVIPRLPARWQTHPGLRYLDAPSLVGLAALTLLGIRLTVGPDSTGQGLELLSGWDFFTAETVSTLTIRADTLSLPFLLLTILTLLAVTLAVPVTSAEEQPQDIASWLALGAGACFLFVSANGLTLIYAILGFDVLTLIYWLRRGQPDLGVARLFLGIFTATGVVLAALAPASAPILGALWLGLALWLRLGLYPFIEATFHAGWSDYGRLVYLSLSLTAGIYLVLRTVAGPLPELIRWLAVGIMLLSGLLSWLADRPPSLLTRLILTEAGLLLLIVPLYQSIATAFAVGLILSGVVLWITPPLGQPRLTEGAWSWPYLPALAATLTLIGLPFSLGWLAHTAVYQSLFLSGNTLLTWLTILAEALALSSLVRYWLILWQGNDRNERQSMVGIIAMVPFLIPGLAPFILSTLIRVELPMADFEQPVSVWAAMSCVLIGAVILGYFRDRIVDRLKFPPSVVVRFVRLRWLLTWWTRFIDRAGKFVLRIRVLLEGQHYLGWALFTALIGVLIILLRT